MKNRALTDPPPVNSARVRNAKQPRWRAEKSTALAIRLQLAKNEHDESASSSKARENFAIFVKTKAETKTLDQRIRPAIRRLTCLFAMSSDRNCCESVSQSAGYVSP
jgi:hypothetical protein